MNSQHSPALRDLQSRLSQLCVTIDAQLPPTKRTVILRNIARRAATEVAMLTNQGEGGSEFLAWRARNLFELLLRFLYVVDSPEAVNAWFLEAWVDEVELIEGYQQLYSRQRENPDRLTRRLSELRVEKSIQSVDAPKHLTMSELAKRVGEDAFREYKAFWKLYSKYIHPSSLLVNGPIDGSGTHSFDEEFVERSMLYTTQILAGVSTTLCIEV